jgi:hypothetical protein
VDGKNIIPKARDLISFDRRRRWRMGILREGRLIQKQVADTIHYARVKIKMAFFGVDFERVFL